VINKRRRRRRRRRRKQTAASVVSEGVLLNMRRLATSINPSYPAFSESHPTSC
jgi:hypothetical protein